jgi:hypothetical protein
MKMSENKVGCHIGQVSCMNLEFSLARKHFHLSRAIGQAGRCTTEIVRILCKAIFLDGKVHKVRKAYKSRKPTPVGPQLQQIGISNLKT